MRRAAVLWLCLCLACRQGAAASASPTPDLILEVRLDQHVLSDGVGAFQHAGDVLLPLGEMARLLTIAIRTEPAAGRASGYVLDEDNGFALDLGLAEVAFNGQRQRLDAAQVRRQGDDLYVPSRLLAIWLPVDIDIDMATLSVQVRPRQRLPLQARLERSGRAPGGAGPSEAAYPLQKTPYALAGTPFIDQTIGLALARERGPQDRQRRDIDYAAYLSADLAGMEAALFLSHGQRGHGPATRLTLGRHDPDAGLLGPLRARAVEAGHVAWPGMAGIALGGSGSAGLALSNRPLGQPTRFDRHSLRGDLPPGWEVELYFNDALVGYQQARADGKYSFDDQALVYGHNEFRLVFHGPLGQQRIERHSFLLEQAQLAPGALEYSLVRQRDAQGRPRASAQFDLGLAPRLSAGVGVVRLALDGQDRRYANATLRAWWQGMLIDAAKVRMQDGGTLAHLGLKTRLGSVALAAGHTRLHDFLSELYRDSHDPVVQRDELRVDALAGGMPVTVQGRRDLLASGASARDIDARVSAWHRGTAFTHALHWRSHGGARQADGTLQASRRLAGVGLLAQLQYGIAPERSLRALALSADKYLGDGYQLNASLARNLAGKQAERQYRAAVALNKSLGSFGLGVYADVTSRGSYSAGLTLFMALGREPRSGRWISDAVPMAAGGAASARVFLDRNLNGIMDGDEPPIKGAGFRVNGGPRLARTDHTGVAWLDRLPAGEHTDIGFDATTLEDPQWQPRVQGIRVLPRPGKVHTLEFAVAVTGDIDGTARLRDRGGARGVGDLEIELLDPAGKVAASTRSGADGYYVLSGVLPGRYQLRVAPAQLGRLQLQADGPHPVVMDDDGSLVSGRDLGVSPLPPDASTPAQSTRRPGS